MRDFKMLVFVMACFTSFLASIIVASIEGNYVLGLLSIGSLGSIVLTPFIFPEKVN